MPRKATYALPNVISPSNPVIFDPDLCTGCNNCVEVCQVDVFIPNPEEEMPPTYGKMLEFMFDTYGEIHLIEPTFVTYYPKEISPLSKVSRIDKRETERFELFISGQEILYDLNNTTDGDVNSVFANTYLGVLIELYI